MVLASTRDCGECGARGQTKREGGVTDERKAIFITGGASGIGLATAKLFANRGWTVGIADVDAAALAAARSEEHTSELQSHVNLVCRLLLEKKKKVTADPSATAFRSSSDTQS